MALKFNERDKNNKRQCIAQISGKQCKKPAYVANGLDGFIVGTVFPYCTSCNEAYKDEYVLCNDPLCNIWLHRTKDPFPEYEKCYLHGGRGYLYLGGSYKKTIQLYVYQNKQKCLWKAKNGRRCANIPDLGTNGKLFPYCTKHYELLPPEKQFSMCSEADCFRWVPGADLSLPGACSLHDGEDYLKGSFEESQYSMYGFHATGVFREKPSKAKK